MTKRTWGILATMVGSAVGAWWFTTQLRARTAPAAAPARGKVIFDNTPTPSDIEGVI